MRASPTTQANTPNPHCTSILTDLQGTVKKQLCHSGKCLLNLVGVQKLINWCVFSVNQGIPVLSASVEETRVFFLLLLEDILLLIQKMNETQTGMLNIMVRKVQVKTY